MDVSSRECLDDSVHFKTINIYTCERTHTHTNANKARPKSRHYSTLFDCWCVPIKDLGLCPRRKLLHSWRNKYIYIFGDFRSWMNECLKNAHIIARRICISNIELLLAGFTRLIVMFEIDCVQRKIWLAIMESNDCLVVLKYIHEECGIQILWT